MTGQSRPPRRPEDIPDDFVIVGQIVGVTGLRGALRVRLETEFPERLVRGREFVVGDRRYRLRHARVIGTGATITLEGVDDRATAESLRGEMLLTPKAELPPLPDGSYYIHQLIGLRVHDRTGEPLGPLIDVLVTGANDVYVVETPNGLLYLPAVDDVILDIDLAAGILVAAPLEGSLPTPPRRPSKPRGRRRAGDPTLVSRRGGAKN